MNEPNEEQTHLIAVHLNIYCINKLIIDNMMNILYARCAFRLREFPKGSTNIKRLNGLMKHTVEQQCKLEIPKGFAKYS